MKQVCKLPSSVAYAAMLMLTGQWCSAADTPGDAAAQAAATAQTPIIEDVVVTARRIEEGAQSVPVTISALSATQLQNAAVLQTRDLQAHVTGLVITNNSQGGAPTFAIRAATQVNGSAGSIATYVDDVPMTSNYAIANSLYDINSVDVLKGPQGTLFGVNTTGGAIIFRPNKPTEQLEGYLQIGGGNMGYRQVQGMFNLPVNDILQLRAAGELIDRAGFIRNISPVNGNSRLNSDRHGSARFEALATFTPQISNLLASDYYDENDQPDQFVPVGFNNAALHNYYPGNSFAAQQTALGPFNVELSDATYRKIRLWGASDTFNYELSKNVSLKNVVGYRRDHIDTLEDSDGFSVNLVNGRTLTTNKQFTEELDLFGNAWDDRARFVGGFFYDDKDNDQQQQYKTLQGTPYFSNSYSDQLRKFKSKAVFGQASYDLTSTLTASAGLRYTWDSGNLDYYQVSNNPPASIKNPGAYNPTYQFGFGNCAVGTGSHTILSFYKSFNPATCTATNDGSWSAPSYTFTLEDKIASSLRVYATARSGYQAGGFNVQIRDLEHQTFEPTKVHDFEAGVKSDWSLVGRPVRTNLAAFYGKYKNMQRVENGSYPPPIPGTYIAIFNAGSAKFYGLDFDGSIFVTDSVELSFNATQIKAYYTDYEFPAVGSTPAQNLTGFPLSQTPEHTYSAQVTYHVPVRNDHGNASLSFSGYYRSSTAWSDVNVGVGGAFNAYNIQPDYTLLNLAGDWSNVWGSKVDLGFFVKNLADKHYGLSLNNQLGGLGYVAELYGEPRFAGVTVRYHF